MKKALTLLTLILTLLGQALQAEAAEITLKCQMYRQEDKVAISPMTVTLDPSTNHGTQAYEVLDGKIEQVIVLWEGSKASFGTKFGSEKYSYAEFYEVDLNTGGIEGLSVMNMPTMVLNILRFGTCKRIK
jgi:hypothetical protein